MAQEKQIRQTIEEHKGSFSPATSGTRATTAITCKPNELTTQKSSLLALWNRPTSKLDWKKSMTSSITTLVSALDALALTLIISPKDPFPITKKGWCIYKSDKDASTIYTGSS
jgi:hypothetical protein